MHLKCVQLFVPCGHLFLPLKSKSDLKLSFKFQFIRQVNQYSSKGKAKQNQLKFITTEDMILSSVIQTIWSNDRTNICSYLHRIIGLPSPLEILATFSMDFYEFGRLRFYSQILVQLFSVYVTSRNESGPSILVFWWCLFHLKIHCIRHSLLSTLSIRFP